jgi:hypothetical protein
MQGVQCAPLLHRVKPMNIHLWDCFAPASNDKLLMLTYTTSSHLPAIKKVCSEDFSPHNQRTKVLTTNQSY